MKFYSACTLTFLFTNILSNVVSMSISKYNFTVSFNDTTEDFKDDVRFFLYTRRNPDEPQQLWLDDEDSLKKSFYKVNRPTKFMTHGWDNDYHGKNCLTIRKAFLEAEDYNVIIVDWGNVAKLPYLQSAGKIKAVGGYIAKMINFLKSQGSDTDDMSLVGHSLGAHLMGLAGSQTLDKVGHVVGLDPAGPGFESTPGLGLSPNDAKLVEVIHTNAGFAGLERPAGHVDYYPNGGGLEQPGCDPKTEKWCSHDRAFIYYAESMKSPQYWYAIRCTDYSAFLRGECDNGQIIPFPNWSRRDNKNNGLYFLKTADREPFGLGIMGVKSSST